MTRLSTVKKREIVEKDDENWLSTVKKGGKSYYFPTKLIYSQNNKEFINSWFLWVEIIFSKCQNH